MKRCGMYDPKKGDVYDASLRQKEWLSISSSKGEKYGPLTKIGLVGVTIWAKDLTTFYTIFPTPYIFLSHARFHCLTPFMSKTKSEQEDKGHKAISHLYMALESV